MESGLASAARLAVQKKILNLVGKFFERSAQVDAIRRRRNIQHVNQSLRRRTRPQPAIEKWLRPIVDHLRRIEIVFAAQAVALGTGAVHTVERERTRLQLRHADAAIGAGQLFRIKRLLAAHHRNLHQAARQLHRQAHRHFQAMLDSRLHQQAVDHDFNRMIFALVEILVVIQIHQLAVDARPAVAVLDQRFHLFPEFAFAPADYRRQHHHAVFRSQRHHPLHNLVGSLSADGASTLGTMRHADRSE